MKKIFNTNGTDTALNNRSGQEVEILRVLTATEVDIPDVGRMYRIRFADGCETDAFEDELFLRTKQAAQAGEGGQDGD